MQKRGKIFFREFQFDGKVYVFDDYKFYNDESFVDERINDKKAVPVFTNEINRILSKQPVPMAILVNGNVVKPEASNFDELDGNRFVVYNEGSHCTKWYSIQKYGSSLYMELAKLNVDLKNLMDFFKTWGIPSGLISDINSNGENDGFALLIRPDDKLCIWGSDLCSIYYKILEYKHDFSMFESVMLNDPSLLESSFDSIEEIKKTLSYRLKKHTNLSYKLSIDENGIFVPKATFSNLFDIAYLQMVKALINSSRLRRCKYCGHIFEVTYEGMKFCPPLPFRGRSSCEMAYNNRLKKARKLYKEGRTLEEIDKLVDLPIEEIKADIERREGGK